MIDCLRTGVHKQPIIALYFVFVNELKFYNLKAWPRGYKTFLCSAQQSTKLQLFIKTKIPKRKEVSSFKSLRSRIYHANKC